MAASLGGSCRAFVQFSRIEHAMSFMDKNHPMVLLDLGRGASPDGGVPVYPHFARSRNGQDPRYQAGDAYWICATVSRRNLRLRIEPAG